MSSVEEIISKGAGSIYNDAEFSSEAASVAEGRKEIDNFFYPTQKRVWSLKQAEARRIVQTESPAPVHTPDNCLNNMGQDIVVIDATPVARVSAAPFGKIEQFPLIDPRFSALSKNYMVQTRLENVLEPCAEAEQYVAAKFGLLSSPAGAEYDAPNGIFRFVHPSTAAAIYRAHYTGSKVILLCNTAYGRIEDIPICLRAIAHCVFPYALMDPIDYSRYIHRGAQPVPWAKMVAKTLPMVAEELAYAVKRAVLNLCASSWTGENMDEGNLSKCE